ncbi:hypothetical protein ACIKP9_00385 [Methylobacillus methanolivorans]|uniref:Glycoside hydrolase family 5 domain-containing protein n=1 Tax=Methylobacillus methanolivorans TaxID=1848927 RepID=A0ABW8GH36_9PROT
MVKYILYFIVFIFFHNQLYAATSTFSNGPVSRTQKSESKETNANKKTLTPSSTEKNIQKDQEDPNVIVSDNFIYGVGIHAGQEKITFANAKALISASGANSFRDEVFWHRLERIKGEIGVKKDLAGLDALINWEETNPLIILNYGNQFYDSNRQPYTNEGRQAFVRYADYVSKRYSTQVFGFEIWNEWNIGFGNADRQINRYGDPEQYYLLVKEVSTVVKKNAPSAKVLCGAVTDLDSAWIEKTLKLGIMKYCDGYSLHPYNFSIGKNAVPYHAFSWVDYIWRLMIKYNSSGEKKIYITELGWPNHTEKYGISADLAAAYLAQSFIMAKSREYIGGLWWYELVDSGLNAKEKEHNFGLVNHTFGAKQAFNAFHNIVSKLKGATFVNGGVLSSDRLWARFNLPNGKQITALWTIYNGDPKDFHVKAVDNNAYVDVVPLADNSSYSFDYTKDVMRAGPMPLIIEHDIGALNIE